MKTASDISSATFDHRNAHVLYVEGGNDSIDVEVLREYLGNILSVKPLGSSLSIRSVAESLYPTHPTYYFLIDRDHYFSGDNIDVSWRNFPDPNTHNLLIWRRKEFENYFLEPDFLLQSQFLKSQYKADKGEKLREKIVFLAQKRLYLDAANYVIVSLREDFKQTWVEKFTNPSEFPNKQDALKKLASAPQFKSFSKTVSTQTAKQKLEKRFQEYLTKMTNGRPCLEFGVGDWLWMISGKPVFHALVSQCFEVSSNDTKLTGRKAYNLLARDLLRTGKNLPNDLIELKQLIQQRIK